MVSKPLFCASIALFILCAVPLVVSAEGFYDSDRSMKVGYDTDVELNWTISFLVTYNDRPVRFARVATINGKIAGETDEEGRLTLPLPQPGTYTFRTTKSGYRTREDTVEYYPDRPYCGDAVCQGAESFATCPADCEKPVEQVSVAQKNTSGELATNTTLGRDAETDSTPPKNSAGGFGILHAVGVVIGLFIISFLLSWWHASRKSK